MKNYKDIDGWFNYSNTYDFLLSTIPDNGKFVECGAWLGKSSAYLCDNAQDKISIFIVDSWEGSLSQDDPTHNLARQFQNTYELFISNMGNRKFTAIRKLSDQAAFDFDNNSCDVIFIDMTHTYEQVKNDIMTWLPKVKIDGYLAGHDYHSDWPGVILAVDEIFGKENIIIKDTCWIYHNAKNNK